MAARVLGIEIGERLIKVCETNLGSGIRKVSGCIMVQTPLNAVADGEIKDPEAVAAVLRESLLRNGLKNKKVIFTVSSARIAIREVMVPPVKDSKIKSLIEANATDYFPVDMSSYHMTYLLQERKLSGDDAGCRLLVMAAPIAILEGYFKLAEHMSFQVQALDYSGNSQYRFLETLSTEGVTMYIDINGAYSITTVMNKNKLLMQRTFPSGVDDYILELLSSADKNESAYMDALKELSTGQYSLLNAQETPPDEMNEYLSRLVGNVSRIADYYNSSNWETPIERLVLTGIGASVVGLKDEIAESTGIVVSIMQRLDKVSAADNLLKLLPQYISCMGCAIAPVDLIPERFSKAKMKEAKKKKESISIGITVLAACIVGSLTLSATAYLNYLSALDEKTATENQISDLAYTENVYNTYLSYNKYKADLTVLEKAIESPNDKLRLFIDELEKKMPAEVNILSASCAKESISMNITVTSKIAAAKTIQQLRSFESIADIVVGQITESVDGSGIQTVTFAVECKYNFEPFVIPPQVTPKAAAPTSGTQAAAAKPTGSAG